MPGTFDVSITVTKTGTEASHVFKMTDTASGLGYERTDRFFGQTADTLADLQAVADATQKQAMNAAQKKRLPVPEVNGNNLTWSGLSKDEAESVRDHAIEHGRHAEKEMVKLHTKHLAAKGK